MKFDPLEYKYGSRRNTIYAGNGMACSTSPIAAGIGVDVMKKGGTAIDAAVAMAAAMPVLEPTGNGYGADNFVLIWTGGKLYGMNGSGYSPKALNADVVKQHGFDTIPMEGWLPVMMPGAVGGIGEIYRRFGTRPLQELFAPAIKYAREGFPVPINVAKQLVGETARLNKAYAANPELYQAARDIFTKNGEPLVTGDILVNKDAADTLEELAATNCESFYRGSIMKKIVTWSQKTGGFFQEEDFTSFYPQWVDPISINYKGYDVFEMPPNGHGITALMALNILKKMALTPERDTGANFHKMIEAIKLAFVDTKKFVADPRFMQTKVSDMLSEKYADLRRGLINEQAIMPEAGDPSCGGTIYFNVADGKGNMVSWIQSNYARIGSLVVVPGTGIAFNDRAANFSMDPASDNYYEGGKQAYHTIIPGFLAKDGKPVGPFGVMGGFMQPQGHLLVVVNTVDYHMNPQECLDAPRFQWVGGKKVQLEKEVPEEIVQDLIARGHEVEIVPSNIGMGRGEIIWVTPNGALCGGTEPRADGTITCF